MKCCYKILDENGEIMGVEGIYDTEVEDWYDELFNRQYIAITLEEYNEVCEQLGIDPK